MSHSATRDHNRSDAQPNYSLQSESKHLQLHNSNHYGQKPVFTFLFERIEQNNLTTEKADLSKRLIDSHVTVVL